MPIEYKPDGYVLRKVTRTDGTSYENHISYESALAAITQALLDMHGQPSDPPTGIASVVIDETTGRGEIVFESADGDHTGWLYSFSFISTNYLT